jgi:hypothetical protein
MPTGARRCETGDLLYGTLFAFIALRQTQSGLSSGCLHGTRSICPATCSDPRRC